MKKQMEPIVVRGILNMRGVDLWLLPGVMVPLIFANWLLNKWQCIEAYQTMFLNIIGAIVVTVVFWSIAKILGMKGGDLYGTEYQGERMRYQLYLISYVYGLIVVIGSILGRLLQIGLHELREKWHDWKNGVNDADS